MKTIIRISTLFLMIAISVANVRAVTDQEMERAKTIAAKAYLRYANNGSGYLDDQKPATMAELKNGLKAKEIENLKTFNAVAVPKDYASWDKNKLIEYWSVTFFKAPGLIEAGKGARNVVRKQVSAMNVAAPGTMAETKPKEESDKDVKTNIPVSLVEDEPAAQSQQETAAAAELERKKLEADSIAALVAADTGVPDEPKKKSSGTWIYVSILIALIAVVVWLVVYASKTMTARNNAGKVPYSPAATEPRGTENTTKGPSQRSDSALKSEFAQTIARKNDELKRMSDELQSLGQTCRELEDSNRHLEGENTRLMAEVESLRMELTQVKAAHVANPGSSLSPAVEKNAHRPKRSIYLGRVNARGLFVRADRTLNAEGSVYLIETEDGYNGSFRVVNVPEVCERVLSNPTQWLAGGCVAPDLLNTGGMTEIHTDASGDAVFESGCWRVVRKAKISYS